MYALDASRLVGGDIIFTRDKTSSSSWVIRAGTLSDYSHAILYVGHHSFIDSDLEGVHSNNLQRLLFDRIDDVAVKRLKHPPPLNAVQFICDYARNQVGQQYSRIEAARAAFPKTGRIPGKRQFCSRLVAQAYASAGIQLVIDPDFCTPQDIFASEHLVPVGDTYRTASAAQIALAAYETRNHPKRQEKVTNDFLGAVRQATGTTVSTLESIVHLVAQNPHLDSLIAGLLTKSGYLTMWEWDLKASPHWYDAAIFAKTIPNTERARVADDMLSADEDALRRHQSNLAIFIALNEQRPLRTLELLISLEQKLCELCNQRLSVFKAFAAK